ncbi:MAG: dimethyl sulfoxide reductase anchor subunit, partial [Alphaproteobacteria bacterium]|nr:dimethyl sulfoxide reductase anchor subunit [Alphaproteobacteria bacterium]
MHPAKSVIFFTTISGAGFGFIALLSLAICFGIAAFDTALFTSAIIAVGLSSAGLISSTFHLGNPQRAWRALSQYQSSWLSREGVLSVITLAAFVLWLGSAFVTGHAPLWIGAAIAILCGLTIFATAMIYAQLKPVPRWHSHLTPASYLGF